MLETKVQFNKKDSEHPGTDLRDFIRTPEFYHLLAESITDVIWVIDVNLLNVVYVSPAIEQLLGYFYWEVVEQPLISFMPQESLDIVNSLIEREKENQEKKAPPPELLEIKLLHKDGTVVWSELSFSYIRSGDDNAIGMLGVARDSTHRVDMMETLRVSEERYRTVLEEIEEGYCEVDLAGNVVFINQAGLNAVGYSEDEILSMNYKEIYSQEDQPRVFEVFNQVYETGEPYKDLVAEMIKKDGTLRQHEMSVLLIRDRHGRPSGFRGITRDITARRQKELKLKKTSADLDRRVMERTNALKKINMDLEERTRSLEEANIALHVFMNKKDETRQEIEARMVFNVMEAVSPMLEKLKSGQLNEKQQIYLELIEEQLKKITSPFSQNLSMQYRKLTPTEIQIANFIKHGRMTKEIAELANLATSTIESHRKSIRKKFEIDNRKINLRTYLLSLDK